MSEFETGRGVSRRRILAEIAGIGAAVAVSAAVSASPASAWSGPLQAGWRFCNKCFGMILIGGSTYQDLCPAGGQHVAQGWTFELPYNYSTTGGGEDGTDQANWWRCVPCSGLFWSGSNSWTAGVCPTGSQHDPIDLHNNIGPQYVLPHDIGAPPGTQEWRFCVKCSGLFFNGYATLTPPLYGVCPAGWGHAALGDHFAIPVYSY